MRSDIKKKIEAFQSGGNGADAAEEMKMKKTMIK